MAGGSFNIHGLMSASAQLEKLAQVMRNGREGAQLHFAAEVEKNVADSKGRVAPPAPPSSSYRVEDDRRREGQTPDKEDSPGKDGAKHQSEALEDSDPEHHIDLLV